MVVMENIMYVLAKMKKRYVQRICNKRDIMSWIKMLILGFLIMLLYTNSVFYCLPELTYTESKMVFLEILLISILIAGWLAYWERKRIRILNSLLIGCGIYTAIAYRKVATIKIILVLIISVVCVVLYVIKVMRENIRKKQKSRNVFLRHLCRCVQGCCSIFAIGMVVLMFWIGISQLLEGSVVDSQMNVVESDILQEYTIENSMDTLLLLRDDEWGNLAVSEKLKVMQVVANIEARYLGLPDKLNIVVDNLPENTLGRYLDKTQTIYIDLSYLESSTAEEVLNVCCHEAYHSYQYRLIEAYTTADEDLRGLKVYRKSKIYLEEFNDYEDTVKDLYAYYNLQCEEDARAYAEDAVEDYFSKINSE